MKGKGGRGEWIEMVVILEGLQKRVWGVLEGNAPF